MSYTETHVGKLKLLQKGITLKEALDKFAVDPEGYNKASNYAYFETENDIFYVWKNNNLYKNVVEFAGESEGYLCRGDVDNNGDINYVLQFYNGGTYEGEMFEDLLNK